MNYSLVKVPSTFSSDRRPIYAYPIANVTHKDKDHAYPRLVEALGVIAGKHSADRILVHTVSYQIATFIRDNSPALADRICIYGSAQDRDRAIHEYRSRPGAILLASSLERGIDLPGDDCRAIVVCKIPYPNLGDKQVSARIHSYGGQLWYNVQTVRSLVQMTGRGMRSADDYCESYILDEQFFNNIWRRNRGLLPGWWEEAIVRSPGKLL